MNNFNRRHFPPPSSSTNKSDRHDINEKFLKVPLNTIKQNQTKTSLNAKINFQEQK